MLKKRLSQPQTSEANCLHKLTLRELEELIRRDLPAFVRVGQALCEIRDRRLFREQYPSFEAYCRFTWGICRQHGYRLIQTSKIALELSPNGDTSLLECGESQLRALGRLKDPALRKKAYDLAVTLSPTGRPTAVQIKVAVNRILLHTQAMAVANALPHDSLRNDVVVIHGDTANSKLVEAESVHVIVGSPPYNIGAQYPTVDDLLGHGEYFEKMRLWLANCWLWSVHEGGRLALNVPVDTRKNGPYPFAGKIVEIAQAIGWKYESTIVWDEGSHSGWHAQIDPVAVPSICCRCELILLFSKGGIRRSSSGNLPDITHEEVTNWSGGYWNFPGAHRGNGHPCRFPPELPRRLIKLLSYSGDTVLDPWCGSGTTLVEAIKIGRYAIGIDIEEQYCRLAEAALAGFSKQGMAV